MLPIVISSLIALAAPGTRSVDVEVQLRARVSPQCGVSSIAHSGDLLTVQTFCNTERFRLELTSTEGAPVALSAESAHAQVTIMPDALEVRLRQPGFQQVAVRLAEGVDPATVSARLLAG